MWATMALSSEINQPNPPFPTRVSYGSRAARASFVDPRDSPRARKFELVG